MKKTSKFRRQAKPIGLAAKSPVNEQAIQQVIDKDKLRLDIGDAGASFIEAVTNPFGSELARGPIGIHARYPDGARSSIPLTLTGTVTILGSTTTSGVLTLIPPDYTAGNVGLHVWTAGLPDYPIPGVSPTHRQLVPCRQATIFEALGLPLAGFPSRIRLVGGGIRVNAISSTDNSQGTLQACISDKLLVTGAATYADYGAVVLKPVEEVHIMNPTDGITVRAPFDSTFTWGSVPGTYYQNPTSIHGNLPHIIYSGLSATSIMLVDFVWHLELESLTDLSPFPVEPPALEPEFMNLGHFCQQFEIAVGGHSFKSFLKKVATMSKIAFRFIQRNRDVIMPAATRFMQLALA